MNKTQLMNNSEFNTIVILYLYMIVYVYSIVNIVCVCFCLDHESHCLLFLKVELYPQ